MIDSALIQISEELPFVTNIILQTDNAKSYNSTFLLYAIHVLNVMYKHKNLSIIEFIHTEIQDGKTLLDAFFATCMKFIQNYLAVAYEDNQVAKICTAKELGAALAFRGGMKNTMIQVVYVQLLVFWICHQVILLMKLR